MKWLLGLLFSVNAFAQAQTDGLQNEDFKSLADLHASAATITGTLNAGNPCIVSPSSLAGIAVGQFVYDATNALRLNPGTFITAIPGACAPGQIRLSSTAAGSAVGDTITFGGQMSQLLNDSKIYVASQASQLSSLFTNNTILTNSNSVTVTGKTMDAGSNTFTGITVASLSSGAQPFGKVATADGAGAVAWSTPLSVLSTPYDAKNYTLNVSYSSNSMIIALKTQAGTDPAPMDPVIVSFVNAVTTNGNYIQRTITSPVSVTVPAGTTLGCAAAINCGIYVYLYDNSGTIGMSVSTSYWTDRRHSSLAIAGANTALNLYSNTLVSGVAFRLIGVVTTTETSGNWFAANPGVQILPIKVFAEGQLYAGLSQPNGTGAGCNLSTTAGTVADIPANAACTGHTYIGNASPVSNDYRLRVGSLLPGKYVVTGALPMSTNSAVATTCEAYFLTTTIGPIGYGQWSQSNATANGPNGTSNLGGWLSTSTYVGTTDFYWRWRRIGGSGNCVLTFNDAGAPMMMSVTYYPFVDGA